MMEVIPCRHIWQPHAVLVNGEDTGRRVNVCTRCWDTDTPLDAIAGGYTACAPDGHYLLADRGRFVESWSNVREQWGVRRPGLGISLIKNEVDAKMLAEAWDGAEVLHRTAVIATSVTAWMPATADGEVRDGA